MYIVNYGLAPYFKQLPDVKLKRAPLYTLSFDESLNPFLSSWRFQGVWKCDTGLKWVNEITQE